MPDIDGHSARPGHGLAVAGLVLGILGMLCFLPGAIAAIILGSMAASRIGRAPEPREGMGMARAGRTLGIAGVALFLIAGIAIPNLIRSRLVPGEASSVSGLRTLNTAEITYTTTYPKVGFSPDLAVLGSGGTDCKQPTQQHACLIDDILASGTKSGFLYRYTPGPPGKDGVVTAYTIHVDPAPPPQGWLDRLFGSQPVSERHFFSDESAVIRMEKGREAGPQSPPL